MLFAAKLRTSAVAGNWGLMAAFLLKRNEIQLDQVDQTSRKPIARMDRSWDIHHIIHGLADSDEDQSHPSWIDPGTTCVALTSVADEVTAVGGSNDRPAGTAVNDTGVGAARVGGDPRFAG